MLVALEATETMLVWYLMPPVLKSPIGLLQDQLLGCLPPFTTFSDNAMLVCQLQILQCCTRSYTFADFCGFKFAKLAYSDLPR